MVVKVGLAPLNKNLPTGAMSAPRRGVLTLVSPGTQILDGSWCTVIATRPCVFPWHDPMCQQLQLLDGRRWVHLPLSTEWWMRHPIGGAL